MQEMHNKKVSFYIHNNGVGKSVCVCDWGVCVCVETNDAMVDVLYM